MIIFIVPAYNEEKNILTLLNKTSKHMRQENISFRVIVVNDGSTDRTAQLAESLRPNMPVEVLSHYPNKGVGEAFRVGFSRALEICKDDDIIITKEADNTSDLSILNNLIAKINHSFDLVLASCYAKEGAVLGTTFLRLILSKAANALIQLLFPLKNINTYSSFYRAYRASALREMHNIYGNRLIEENGFECMVELLVKFSRNTKFKITEVPMILNGNRRQGKSKMRVLRTMRGFLKVMIKEGIIKGSTKNKCLLRK
jgi:dolichol-phosphate mannosyltransferase